MATFWPSLPWSSITVALSPCSPFMLPCISIYSYHFGQGLKGLVRVDTKSSSSHHPVSPLLLLLRGPVLTEFSNGFRRPGTSYSEQKRNEKSSVCKSVTYWPRQVCIPMTSRQNSSTVHVSGLVHRKCRVTLAPSLLEKTRNTGRLPLESWYYQASKFYPVQISFWAIIPTAVTIFIALLN